MLVKGIHRRGLMAVGAVLGISSVSTAAAAAGGGEALHPTLANFSRFLGKWVGAGEGQPGTSRVERTYEPTLKGRFILERNRSTYAPQEKNPKGEVHDHVGYMSFDKTRGRLVLRQFHPEGFVNQFVAATATIDGETFVLDSEAIENIPAGWRARETYKFASADAFEEVFELSEPGKGFEVYSHNRFKRA
jgi:hypothetical protein